MKRNVIYILIILISVTIAVALVHKRKGLAYKDEPIVTQGIEAAAVASTLAKTGVEQTIQATVTRLTMREAFEVAVKFFRELSAQRIFKRITRQSAEEAIKEGAETVGGALTKQVTEDIAKEGGKNAMGGLAQMAAVMIAAYLPMGMSLGMATLWESLKDQKYFQKVDQKRKGIERNFDNFVRDAQAAQQKKLFTLAGAFKVHQQQIGAFYKASGKLIKEQLQTLNKSMSLALPKRQFLVDHIAIDKAFARSRMLTPQGPHTWFNVSQYGDWQFNEKNNSFIQNKVQAFYDERDPKNPEYAQNNSIFAEYITDQEAYEVIIDCTIYRVTYPFLAGIMINRAHWISGEPERMRQYRLIGLYGTKNGEVATMKTHFAETRTQKSGKNITILSPIKQITNPVSRSFSAMNAQNVSDIAAGTMTLRFKILTSAKKVEFKVWPKGETDQETDANEPLNYFTVDNLLPIGFLYSGIGFMAPGCIAEFSIIKPEKLRYTTNQLQAFTQNISAKLQQRSP